MKSTFFAVLFCLITLSSRAQSLPSKIYIIKNGSQTLGSLQISTTLDPSQVINIKNNSYVIIETKSDSIGIFKSAANLDSENQTLGKKQKPVFIKLEPNKSYYFKIGPIAYSKNLDVEEMTERSFQLYIGLNGLESEHHRHILITSKNLSKISQ